MHYTPTVYIPLLNNANETHFIFIISAVTLLLLCSAVPKAAKILLSHPPPRYWCTWRFM